ncbi:hypothetical protein VTJ04DRAFT_7984 [Mycothermus thermophilus]|uniref:uncharacterized protein n=1 Tax=Humicola insolens TaxID=85995 RepID=UPI00374281C8
MPNKARDYGDLRVTLTSEYDWRWDDSGTGANRDGAFWHPYPQGELRPVGSVVFEGHPNANNNWAALLIGDSRPAHDRHNPAVAAPVRYDWVWSDKGSGGKHDVSIWRPVAPAGYVALGDVASRGGGAPGTDQIWCVREDLVRPAEYEDWSTWDDRGSGGKWDASFWAIRPSAQSDNDKEWIPVTASAFRFSAGYNKPSHALAHVPVLYVPPPPSHISYDPPKITPQTIPERGKKLNTSELSVTVPFVCFFDAKDRFSLDYITDPFCTITKSVAWKVRDVVPNDSSTTMTQSYDVTTSVTDRRTRETEHTVGSSVSTGGDILVLKFQVTLTYQFRFLDSRTIERGRQESNSKTILVAPYSWVIIWDLTSEIRAYRSNRSVITNQLNADAVEMVAVTEVPMEEKRRQVGYGGAN